MYLVSACLAGFNCRYDGENSFNKHIYELVCKGIAIPVCPEVMGGLSTPRAPMEIINNNCQFKIIDRNGNDCTDAIQSGAEKCIELAKLNNIEAAILKSKSPSCGFGEIYNGNFDGSLIKGNGLVSDLLAKNGIKIYNEHNYRDAL